MAGGGWRRGVLNLVLDGDGGDICGGGVYMEGIGELGFRVRAAGAGCVWMSGRFGRGPWRLGGLGHGPCFP